MYYIQKSILQPTGHIQNFFQKCNIVIVFKKLLKNFSVIL